MASKRGRVDVVRFLQKNGADPKMCDKYGQSPLFIASRNRHLTVGELLLQYDSDPLLCNINGFSPITVSSEHT
jgi:ankyrin repeat protein